MYAKAVLIKSLSLKASNIALSALLVPLTVFVSMRHYQDLAQHVARPVAECQISFLGNVYGCLTLKGTHIGRAQVPLDEHSCSGDIVFFLGMR